MSAVQVLFDDAALRSLEASIRTSTQRFFTVITTEVLPAAQARIDALLNKPAGPVKYPFEFASAKSRAYYFATHEPPYQRTGKSLSWKLVLRSASGDVVELYLENPTSYAAYLFGTPQGAYQTPGHARTGWRLLADQLPEQTRLALSDLSAAWLEVAVEMIGEAA